MTFSNYFDVRKSFPFYGAYHHDKINQWIHMLFVPCIFTTSLQFGANLRLGPISLSDAAAAFYAVSFVFMDAPAGLLYAPVIFAMHQIGTVYLAQQTPLAVALHVLGWIFQFVGHGIFERRRPALFDNLFQSVHAAVFFVWLEFMFMLGYKPSLKRELEGLVLKKMAEFPKKKD